MIPDYPCTSIRHSYTIQGEEVWLELRADVLNVNLGHNKELLSACRTLHDYAEYVHRMRKYARTMMIGDAVDRAIGECIQEGILKEFLEQNRAEAQMAKAQKEMAEARKAIAELNAEIARLNAITKINQN